VTERLDGWRVLERAIELSKRGEAFALATVVWRMGPSSGQDGSRAIVTASGEVYGWVGGACAEPVLVREAQGVIADGRSRLLWLGQATELEQVHVPSGVVAVPISCQSDGALQIFIEPAQHALQLLVVGRSPMAATLTQLAEALDWDARMLDARELTDDMVTRASVVIVATQGHDDEETMERVLRARPRYVGLVASHKRGQAVLGYLADRGVPQEDLDRVRYPVGLDLGHTTHREVAVAVLAELVQLKAAGELHSSASLDTHPASGIEADPEVVDPVCGMTVTANDSNRPYDHEGTTYYFCCPGCHRSFSKDPMAFLTQEAR
jgi:xanthine dehydrogenase accessory factor